MLFSLRPPLLEENDIYFIITTVAPERSDYDHLYALLHDKPDLLEIMLDDPRLFRRVLHEQEIFLKISSYLFFSIVMRQVYKEIKGRAYTFEVLETKERVPVFDTQRLKELLEDKELQEYLVVMLNSFTRTESTVIQFRQGTRTFRRRYSDLDFEDLQELANAVEEAYRFPFYRRLGDLALFVSGVFPEYVARQAAMKEGARHTYTFKDYEEMGRKFYRLAATHEIAFALGIDRVLRLLAENFALICKPLRYFSQKYGHLCRDRWSGFIPSQL